jgi:hypothetical protein
MDIFKPTYLYIKTHNVTNLRYFGKTTRNPYKYSGSGKYWLRHLSIHGDDVSTEVIGLYLSRDEIEKVALDFSTNFNIVESAEWANLKNENGLDGGFLHNDELHNKYKLAWEKRKQRPVSDETRKKMSEARRGKPSGAKGKKRSLEAIAKAKETYLNRHGTFAHTEETKSLMRKPKAPSHGKKVSAALTGKPKTEEHKMKLSAALREHHSNKSSPSSR